MTEAALAAALSQPREPVVFRGGWSAQRTAAFRLEFEAYALSSTTLWQTLGAGKQRIADAWATPGTRLEHALDSLPDGVRRNGPLDGLLRDPPEGSAAAAAQATLQVMHSAVASSRRSIQREPVFIIAPSGPSQQNGQDEQNRVAPSLALTHFDEYVNLALLLIGKKRWYVLEPSKLAWEDGPQSHSPNERLDVSFESHPNLPWRVVDVGPGDLVLLPSGWWHRVESKPTGSVLVNLWMD